MELLAEVFLFACVAANAALMMFIAGVLRKVMNDMDNAALGSFLASLVRHSERSPFMIAIFNVPFLLAIPYLYSYGFRNRWILAGLALWLAVGLVAKAIKYPLYKRIGAMEDGPQLATARTTLNNANRMQALGNLAAAALMAVSFVP